MWCEPSLQGSVRMQLQLYGNKLGAYEPAIESSLLLALNDGSISPLSPPLSLPPLQLIRRDAVSRGGGAAHLPFHQ